jgi:4-hydroxybenzoate polyprenyltransferase
MNWERISEKSASLMAFVVGLGFLVAAFFDSQYRYFHLVVAILALYFGYRQFKKRDTPFQKRERELRRKRL